MTLTGALTKGAAGTYEFAFTPVAGFAPGTTYTVAVFASTNFAAGDFSYTGLPSGLTGTFKIEGGLLKFTVNSDTAAPVLNAPADITVEATGPQGAVATYTATATDAIDGPVNVSFSIPSGSTFALGTTMVTVTATDAAGNKATGTFTVTVVDTTGPVINVPGQPIIAVAAGTAGAVVNFAATAPAVVDGAVAVIYAPQQPGEVFAPGQTIITVTATDARGNQSRPRASCRLSPA